MELVTLAAVFSIVSALISLGVMFAQLFGNCSCSPSLTALAQSFNVMGDVLG
jgi:hypothetical protein